VVMLATALVGYFALFGQLLLLPAVGMLAGTHLSSFFKRRVWLKEGSSAPVLDQLDFFVGGVIGLALSGFYLADLPAMAILTFAVHLASNMIAYKTGLKDVWW